MFPNYPALLVTKLFTPRLRSAHISRKALLRTLDMGLERKLVLVAATAGFGKTTLLADWCSQHAEAACWLSLDDGDNDIARFFSYFIAAIQTRQPQIGQELLAALQSPQPPNIDNVLPTLINQLAANLGRLILVLDDYHVIENQAIHAALTFLTDHLPPQITLVLLTRADPPFPLAKLRAKSDLLELRAATLRFSVEDSALFLNEMMQLQLSPESIQALESRTEGWIAGLQLAAVAMQSADIDNQTFVRNFIGSHRFVLDYLIEEVLSRQPEHVRHFLLQTSILRRLNGALCSAIAEVADGQAMLDYLEKNNLFLVPLDQSRHWYRYHHLFADLLQARLQAEYPDVLRELNQRAAHWHEHNNLPEEAVVYALAANDFEYAAQLIIGAASGVTHRGEVSTLLEWYRAFPPEFVLDHTSLSLQFGMAFALNGRWEEAEMLLNAVEQQEARPDEVLMLAYLVASYRHDAARLAAIAAAAAANPHPDRTTKLVLALVMSLKADLRAACQLMSEVQEASERAGDLSMALTALFHMCRFHVYLGNLHHAYDLCQQALLHIHNLGNVALPMETFVHVSLVRIFIEWNELDKVALHVTQALRLSELSGFVTGMMSSATIMLAELKQAQGDSEGARHTAEHAIAYAERNDPPSEVLWLKLYQVRLLLTQNNISAANSIYMAQSQSLPLSMFYPATIQKITQARLLLAQRKLDGAIAILTRLTTEPPNLFSVEALCLLALARQTQGDSVHALLTLEQALPLAEAENRVRVFLDLGTQMTKLLARFCETYPEHHYAHKLLSNFPTSPNNAQSIEPLSERELDVLRLIVAGHSNEEIAQTLVLALSTIKWYINTLYSKLHVKTRSQAIARAHELKLLTG